MDPKRHPIALRHQPLERDRDALGGRVELGDLGGRLGREGTEGEALRGCPREPRERRRSLLVLAQREDEQGRLALFRCERRRGLERRGRCVVGVVEHEQRRALALARAADRVGAAAPAA